MNVLQATTGASGDQMKSLSDLALKMGKDTAFSAVDASNAMLELARGGISPAQIQAGALAGTMTLAAAGNLEMSDAANIAVQSMGQFNLKGKDMAGIAAALAGAANASSASVSDLSIALAQGGLSAHAVGFSIQETTGILAAFANAGLKGSDAGTSLKTMLTRLQPTTVSATSAMKQLGVITADGSNKFIKANGEFKSAAQIAQVLKSGTEGLTQAEKARLITQAFGSDAQRAATVLAKEGAAGLRPLIKATSDVGAAQKLAAANMKGTAGAMEQLKGSIETVVLKFGLFIAPAVQAGLLKLTAIVNGIGPAISQMVAAFKGNTVLSGAVVALKALGVALVAVGGFLLNNKAAVAGFIATIGIAIVAMKVWAGITKLLAIYELFLAGGITAVFSPVILIVGGIALLVAGLILAYRHSATFRGILAQVGGVIKATLSPILNQLANIYRAKIAPALAQVIAKFREWAPTIQKVIGIVAKVQLTLLKFYIAVLGKVLPILGRFTAFMIGAVFMAVVQVIGILVKIISTVIKVGAAFVNGVKAVAKFASGVAQFVGKALSIVSSIPGKVVGALGNLGSTLFNAGSQLIQGLIAGITSKIGEAIAKVQDGLSKIKNLLPGSPIKDGPLKSWNNTGPTGPGGRLIGLLAKGLDNQGPIDAAMLNLTRRINVPRVGLGDLHGTASVGAGGHASGRMVNIEHMHVRDERAAAEAIERTQRKATILMAGA